MNLSFFFLFLLGLAYCFFRFFHNWRPDPWPSTDLSLPKWQVHRGYWVEGLQENTLESFRLAEKKGLKMVELDVQLSGDGVPVVFHDVNLERLAGRKERVDELTAEEIGKFANAPTLREVLGDKEIVPFINIELKCKTVRDQRLAKAVARVVRDAGAERRIIFSSFNPATLRALWRELPEVPRALLATDDQSDPDSSIYLRKLWLGGWAHAHMLNLDKKMITSSLMKRLSERKIPVAVWTVNDQQAAELLINKGVISIISDRPEVN
ncbi:MAG: hypothetical protein RJB66_839 [Pseudomonadota bacterium]